MFLYNVYNVKTWQTFCVCELKESKYPLLLKYHPSKVTAKCLKGQMLLIDIQGKKPFDKSGINNATQFTCWQFLSDNSLWLAFFRQQRPKT